MPAAFEIYGDAMSGERSTTDGVPVAVGSRILVVQAVLTVLVVGALLLPLGDPTLRVVVGVVTTVMVAFQVGVAWRLRPWREFRPRLLRWGYATVGFWGLVTAVDFLLINRVALRSLVSGLVTAAIFGLIMWFVARRPAERPVEA